MADGLIVRALSSFYYVKAEEKIWECKARGLFKIKTNQRNPLVGDWVEFEKTGESQGYIIDIQPRKNELIRPPISNVDQAILVFSVVEPDFNTVLLDRFIVHVEKANIHPIICLTKIDLLDDPSWIDEKVAPYVKMGYKVIHTSARQKMIEELNQVLQGKISVFAGQSGVGKSSLLNTLIPDLQLDTAIISQKLGRGKHTTRVVQMIELPTGGWVADTPGFSSLDFQGVESQTLGHYFADIDYYSDHCRYRGCLHDKEPGCAVKSAVEQGDISAIRYEHYVQFLRELKELEDNKWR